MSIGMLGKKVGMTQIYNEAGRHVPVTLIEAGPCYVLQVKDIKSDGYCAIQLGFSEKRESVTSKPDRGRFKKAKLTPLKFVREIRTDDVSAYKVGQKIEADIFASGDYVDVTGVSIGKGFQGGMKRWNWSGGEKSHGSMHHRRPGSIQSGPRLTRITKGKHMPGQLGNETVTVQNLELVMVDNDNRILAVKGAVPGHTNGYLVIREARKIPKAAQNNAPGGKKQDTKDESGKK
ncbi:MAG: 50S ribosomal protein L3 [Candidatus Omnitrophota bacterium]